MEGWNNQLSFFCFLSFAWKQNPFGHAISNIEHWWIGKVWILGTPRFGTNGWWNSHENPYKLDQCSFLYCEFLNHFLYFIVDFHLCISLQVLHTIPLDSQKEEVGWLILTPFFSCSSFHSFWHLMVFSLWVD